MVKTHKRVRKRMHQVADISGSLLVFDRGTAINDLKNTRHRVAQHTDFPDLLEKGSHVQDVINVLKSLLNRVNFSRSGGGVQHSVLHRPPRNKIASIGNWPGGVGNLQHPATSTCVVMHRTVDPEAELSVAHGGHLHRIQALRPELL